MNIIDLTRTIKTDMQVFPGTEPPKIELTNTLERNGFREMRLTLYSHTGTHLNAPSHLLRECPRSWGQKPRNHAAAYRGYHGVSSFKGVA